MAQSSAAAVIDLEEFRRRREAQAQVRLAPPANASAPSPVAVPCWIVWVPVWFVA